MNIVFIVIFVSVILACSVVCIVLGRHIAQGKGDSLIAGYNTMPREQQEQYDITRVRRLTAGIMYFEAVILALFCPVALLPEDCAMTTVILLTVIAIIVPLIAINKGMQHARKD